jgi:hypothetical protein
VNWGLIKNRERIKAAKDEDTQYAEHGEESQETRHRVASSSIAAHVVVDHDGFRALPKYSRMLPAEVAPLHRETTD